MRICLVYDCVYPHTVGGAERWYRTLSERLAAAGHEVTYLTRRQWPRGEDAGVAGVDVRAVSPAAELYSGGRRRTGPPVVFGLGVFWHLLRHGRRYDVVHTASFPYFSLLAAGALRRIHGYKLVVDWFEVWTRDYWTEYLGRAGGTVGWLIQRLCLRLRQQPLCFARVVARRCADEGLREPVTVLDGLYEGPTSNPAPVEAAEPLVMFAGRHIPEKRVEDLVPAIALARKSVADLRAVIFGDGPQRDEVAALVAQHGLGDVVELPGFVDRERLDETMGRALCMALPSRREGYGIVIVEAAARGTPSVVVAGPDNAATELVEDGVNGIVAAGAEAQQLAAAFVEIHRRGLDLRRSTHAWFEANAPRISMDGSIRRVLELYVRGDG